MLVSEPATRPDVVDRSPTRNGPEPQGRLGRARRSVSRAFPRGAGTPDPTWLLTVGLVVLDAFLLVANLVHLQRNDPDEPHDVIFSAGSWNGDLDGSNVELFGHVQLVFAVLILLVIAWNRRVRVHAAWGVVLLVVVADDFFMVHERAGVALVDVLGLPAVLGLRPQDLGELMVWSTAAIVLAPVLLVTHLRSSDRRLSVRLAGLMLVVAVFAVGVDMLHVAVTSRVSSAVNTVFTLAETSGELLVMTAILVVVHSAALRGPGPDDAPVRTAG